MSSSRRDPWNSVRRWVILTGSRTALIAAMTAGVVALSALLTATGVVYVGEGSNLATALASGALSGLFTLITVTLSINQLILSRVFGSPSGLSDTLAGNTEFRERVERVTGVAASPNDPAAFLSLVGRGLVTRAERLHAHLEDATAPPRDLEQFADDLSAYGEHLGGAGETHNQFEVLILVLGTEYARYLTETRRLRATTDDLPGAVDESLADVLVLLQAAATMRQFFKTLAIQQDLARLSRRLIYTGFVAVLTAYYLSNAYTTAATPTIPEPYLMPVTSVAAGIVFLPLAVILAHLLRIATVSLYTVSVGGFLPPMDRFEER